MQSCTFERDYIVRLDAFRGIYPEGNGRRYEKGGQPKEIRHAKLDEIKQFHQRYYQPKKLRIFITGQIDYSQLFKVLSKFEDNITAHVPSINDKFDRPWGENTPPAMLTEDIIKTCEFPAVKGSRGYVFIAILGPLIEDIVTSKTRSIAFVAVHLICERKKGF
jgi:Zn-dependent M16 (insulinase) family peptidase